MRRQVLDSLENRPAQPGEEDGCGEGGKHFCAQIPVRQLRKWDDDQIRDEKPAIVVLREEIA